MCYKSYISSLTLLRRLFLLRTSAKCASTLCPRFGVGSVKGDLFIYTANVITLFL